MIDKQQREAELMKIGERCEQRRQELGITRREAGERSGLSTHYVYMIEAGKVMNPGCMTILDLAYGLCVSPEWLMWGGFHG